MLWAVTSSACCWARSPRRLVLRPKKLEIDMARPAGPGSGCGGRRPWARRRRARSAGGRRPRRRWGRSIAGGGAGGLGRGVGGLARRAVAAGVVVGADHAREVVEERELLAHEGAVDRVLAGDLGQQAAQLGAALAGALRVGGAHQGGKGVERHRVGGGAERGAGLGEEVRAI